MKKKEKLAKKEEEEESLYNPQWNVCGGTVIPPHHLEYVLIVN